MDWRERDIQNYFGLPEMEDVKDLFKCAECGVSSEKVISVFDGTGSTYFCIDHMGKCDVSRRLWVNAWFRKYVGNMTEMQLYNVQITEIK